MSIARQSWLRTVRRTLPRRVAPVHNETQDSYLHRLAQTNHVSLDDLVLYLVPGRGDAVSRPRQLVVPLHALAELAGIPAVHLACALPELRPDAGTCPVRHLDSYTVPWRPNEQRPACRRCVAALPEAVTVWARHDQNVCPRHRLWIGPGVQAPEQQVDLADCPDICQAQRHHRNLIRRRGYPRINHFYAEAVPIIDRATGIPVANSNRRERFDRFARREQADQLYRSYDCAASYPERVSLTAVLASPFWLRMATSLDPAEQERFYEHVHRHVLAGRGPRRPRTLGNWAQRYRSYRSREDPDGEEHLARATRRDSGIAVSPSSTGRPVIETSSQ